jgi:hypothetical protein
MRNVFTAILMTVTFASHGQQGKFNSFKLLVIVPDTAILDKTLYSDIDSVQSDYQKRYYNSREQSVKKVRYYQTLSSYSAEVYDFYFNEYEPFSTILEIPNQSTHIASLKKLVDTSKADYIVFFGNVHTEIRDGMPILKLTTSLYSKKTNKIILTKETEGDATSRGDMWTCGSTILSCLFINGVRTSTDVIAPEIVKRQIRH